MGTDNKLLALLLLSSNSSLTKQPLNFQHLLLLNGLNNNSLGRKDEFLQQAFLMQAMGVPPMTTLGWQLLQQSNRSKATKSDAVATKAPSKEAAKEPEKKGEK